MKDIWDKLFGIGLGKTGTHSLQSAMKYLGFIPALHGLKYIDELRNVKFACDIFIAARWKFLDYAYPQARFILTDRDTQTWLASSKNHGGNTIRKGRSGIPDQNGMHLPLRTAESRYILYGIAHFEEDIFVRVKEKHRRDIEAYFANKPDKLLIMDFEKGDGWQKLCHFLDVPEPDIPFPHKNKSS